MLYYTGLILLVIAVSLDGFGVGVSYGMQKIRMPLLSLIIIMCCSGVIVLISMTLGDIISQFITTKMTESIGAIILILIGCFSLWNVLKAPNTEKQTESNHPEPPHTLRTVFTKPKYADLDRSGSISANESFLLGIALAMDAFGAGIGASIIGYPAILTALLIAFMSGSFVFCGMRLGLVFSRHKRLQRMGFLPPILLIALGIFNLF